MILVYSPDITPRHRYIFDFIFNDILGVASMLISNKEDYTSWEGPTICYAENYLGKGLHIRPHGLLSEKFVRGSENELFAWKNIKRAANPVGSPFEIFPNLDPFSIAFYLISRYEEYQAFAPDQHKRFPSYASMACKYDFIGIPLVNILADLLKTSLSSIYPSYPWPKLDYHFIPTFDIDIAFAHLGKGLLRNGAAYTKLILKGETSQLKERILTVLGKRKDPYDNFDLHHEVLKGTGLYPVYFILLGNYGKYDKNLSYHNKQFCQLINKLRHVAALGIHPSFASFDRPGQMRIEINRLSDISGQQVTLSRQHFLRISMPHTYRHLIQLGITDDYSIGYSDQVGFRAGTSTPFCFYDLLTEEKTDLKLHPFIFMDSAFIDNMNYRPDQSVEKAAELIGLVKRYGGEAIGIWHNYAMGETGNYKNWQPAFREIIKLAL